MTAVELTPGSGNSHLAAAAAQATVDTVAVCLEHRGAVVRTPATAQTRSTIGIAMCQPR